MKHARKTLSLRSIDSSALDHARRLQAGLNGLRLDEGGSGGEGGGGSGEGGSGGGSEGGSGVEGGSGGDGGRGYPENTPIVEMTADQQAAYWKAQSRKHEQRAQARADYDDVKAKADQFDEFKKSQLSEQERAVEAAKVEGKKEARREAALDIVGAKIEAAAAGRIEPEQLESALEFLDRSRFLDDDNNVDADKVVAFVSSIAPDTGPSGKGDKKNPDLGQGRRPRGSKASGMDRGREEAERRYGDKSKQQQ